jgi:hypothetical protein
MSREGNDFAKGFRHRLAMSLYMRDVTLRQPPLYHDLGQNHSNKKECEEIHSACYALNCMKPLLTYMPNKMGVMKDDAIGQ